MESTRSVSDKTLFARNLPYGTSDKELEAVFCEYGPLKSCFTVKEKGVVDRCRGFGYVTFTKREDAERAKSSVKVIEGRPVQLSFATRKPPRKKRKKEGGEEGEAVKNPREERKKGGEEVKNPREERKKGGEEVKNTREKKEKGGEEVKNPREKRKKGGGKEAWTNDDGVKNSREEGRTQGGRRRERAHEVDDSNRSDGESDEKSEKEVEEESEEEVEEESEEEESEDDYETRTAQARGGTLKHCKPRSQRGEAKFDVGRIVVLTHLPDSISEKWIRKKCKKFGTIEHIQYPVPNREVPTAFVTFESYKDARCAVEGLNGATHRGTALAAVLLSRENKQVSKKTLRKSRLIVRNLSFWCSKEDVRKVFSAFGEITEVHIPRKPNGHMLGYAFVQFTSYISAMKAVEGMNAKELKGRPVAVDWVVPKEKYELSLGEKERKGGASQGGRRRGEGRGGKEKGREVVSQSDGMNDQSLEEEEEEMSEGESDETGSGGEDDSSSSEELSLEEDEEEDEGEGRRGDLKEDVQEGKTVFVRNVPFDVAEDELRQLFMQFGGVRYCRLVSNPDTGMARGSAFVQFYDPTAVQHCLEAASVKSQQDLCLHGRQLDVSIALSKQEMERLRKHKSNKRERVDKRNLYLAREGVILPDSEAAKDLSKAELTKRMKAYREKKAKLANPNFFVSKTRLSVRNLPTQVNEKQLKSLFLKAAGGPPAMIKQVKILRSTERVDGKGVARSKGFAFVEFSSHDAALIALRGTNNNPELFESKKRLIVEFALEDNRALKLREQRKNRQLASKKSLNGREKAEPKNEEEEETKKSKLLAKKEKWKLKRKARRLRQKESQSDQDHSTTKSLSTNVSPVCSEALLRTAQRLLTPDAVVNSTKVKHELSRVGTKRKASWQEFAALAVEKRQKAFQTKPKRAEDKEEAEFTQMVAKYKKKLFGTPSESRWFE